MKICIDLGATNVKGALFENGTPVKEARYPTVHGRGRDGIAYSLGQTISALFTKEADGIGIASAGDIDEERGVCTYATPNLEGFTGFDFRAFTRANFGLDCAVLNDARAALLGEMYDGGGKAFREDCVVMLTLGSGVGGAYWREGGLADSRFDDRFGHYPLYPDGILCNCGRRGCIEQYLSGRALNLYINSLGIANGEVFTEWQNGNPKARRAVSAYAEELNAALGVIAKTHPFDVCLLGGGVAEGLSLIFPEITEQLNGKIRLAELGNRAGLYGAYRFAEGRR